MQTKPSLWQVIVSVISAFFGVQGSAVRERDFAHGRSWWVYVVVGIVMTLLLIGILVSVSRWIVWAAAQ